MPLGQYNCQNLVPLSFEGKNNTDTKSVGKQVTGAKAFEESSFSCGMLEISPGSKKDSETTYDTETFFVHFAEKKKLLFKVAEDYEFYLSTGAMFFVPPNDCYELINLSETHTAKLTFTLIKKDQIGGDEDDT